jgi:malyl-CoA/(S)-citramalyl-CoA lyase
MAVARNPPDRIVYRRSPFHRPKRLQRSELAVPATSPHFFEKAAKGAADTIFLDLEDAVSVDKKDRARALAVEALNDVDWGEKTMAVRVNALDTPWAYRDIIAVAEQCPRLDMILLPKANIGPDIYVVETLLAGIEATIGRKTPIGIEALIETTEGLCNVEEIARSSERLEALIFGVGDFTLSVRARDPLTGGPNPRYTVLSDADSAGNRTRDWGDPWHFALARIVTACRAYGLRAIDGPFGNVRDEAGYRASAMRASALGFEGKWAIHPAQVVPANEVFSPEPAELEWARRITEAMARAEAAGDGAVLVDGRLVDLAHLKSVQAIMERQALIETGSPRGAR